MASRTEVIRIIKKNAKAYPAFNLDLEGIGLYAKHLQGFTVEELETAMDKLIKECTFFPTIAEICRAIPPRVKYSPEGFPVINGRVIV